MRLIVSPSLPGTSDLKRKRHLKAVFPSLG